MVKKKTNVVDDALAGLPANYLIGLCQFISSKGERRVEWRVYHAFGDLIARDEDADKCLGKAIAQHRIVAPKHVDAPEVEAEFDREHFKAVLERLAFHVGADITLRQAYDKLKEELKAQAEVP